MTMTNLLAHQAVTLRRDRNFLDAAADAVTKTDVFLYSYVVEAEGKTLLRVTTTSSLSQGLKDAFSQTILGTTFGGVSLVVLDADDRPLFLVRREAGLTGSVVFSTPTGQALWKTTVASKGFLSLLDASEHDALTVERDGTLYPTFTCSVGGTQVGVVDAKFNGMAEVFNKTTRYELTFAPGATESQRQAVLAVGLAVDLQFGGNT